MDIENNKKKINDKIKLKELTDLIQVLKAENEEALTDNIQQIKDYSEIFKTQKNKLSTSVSMDDKLNCIWNVLYEEELHVYFFFFSNN